MTGSQQSLKAILDKWTACTITIEEAEEQLNDLHSHSYSVSSESVDYGRSKQYLAGVPVLPEGVKYETLRGVAEFEKHLLDGMTSNIEAKFTNRGFIDVAPEVFLNFCKEGRRDEIVRVTHDAIPKDATMESVELADCGRYVRLWLKGVEPRAYTPQFTAYREKPETPAGHESEISA